MSGSGSRIVTMISNSHIIITLSYRFFVQFILSPVLEIFSLILSKLTTRKSNENVQVLSIIYHQNLSEDPWYDLTNPKLDFIFVHSHFATTHLLQSPNWSLYSIDSTHAYFVRLPQEFCYYNARNSPFLHLTQVDLAQGLARLTLEEFCEFSQQIGPPKGQTVFLSATARSGGTLLCQMLQLRCGVFAFNEPDALTHIDIMHNERTITQEECDQLLISAINIFCKDQKVDQTYIFKPQPPTSVIFPHIWRLMPKIKHIFIFRQNKINCLRSHIRMFGITVLPLYLKLWKLSPLLANWVMGYGRKMGNMLHLITPKDTVDVAYAYYMLPYSVYTKFKDTVPLTFVAYEDIVTRPEHELKRLYRLLQIDQQHMAESLEAISSDSQQNSPYEREKLRKFKVGDLTSNERKIRYMEIDNSLGVK